MKKDLKKLSDEQLVDMFNELAVDMGFDSEYHDTRSYNRRYDRMAAIKDELFYRGRLEALLPGMQHENLWIQYFSASKCRSIARAESTAVFERLAGLDRPGSNPGSVAGEARETLDIIRRGIGGPRPRPPRQ